MAIQPGHHPLHGERGGDPRRDETRGERGPAVSGDHAGAALQHRKGGGSRKRQYAEQEGEFHGSRQRQPHRKASEDGDEAAAGARPHRQALREADEDGCTPGQLREVQAFAMPAQPRCEREDDDAADHPRRDHRLHAEQVFLDAGVEQCAEHRGRQERRDDVDGKLQAIRIASGHSLQYSRHAQAVQPQHRKDGARLDGDGVAIRCFTRRDAEQPLRDQQVSGGTHRQVFGDAFHEPEDQGLQ